MRAMGTDYKVIDYADTSAPELAGLLLAGWQAAPETHQSISTEDDLSYIVLHKELEND